MAEEADQSLEVLGSRRQEELLPNKPLHETAIDHQSHFHTLEYDLLKQLLETFEVKIDFVPR